ncbi:MAG: hypothetical protein ABI054_01230 [Planctomycetota bacterium]
MKNTLKRPGARVWLASLALCAAPAWLAGQNPAPAEPAQKLERMKETLETELADLRARMNEASTVEENDALYEDYKTLIRDACKEARELAEATAGTETAAEAWSFVLSHAPQIGNKELAIVALDALVDKHLASPAWKDIAANLGDMGLEGTRVEKTLRTLIEKSPHKNVQAAAMFSLGVLLGEKEDKALQAEGLALLRRVQKDFADVKEAKSYLARAEATLFKIEKLQPGMPCPDFQATDEAGAKFKLSDYKGKVVLVDFWGYW